MNDNSKTFAALLAVLAVETALGILFAPDTGEDTRYKFSKSLRDLSDTVKERASDELGLLNGLVEIIL